MGVIHAVSLILAIIVLCVILGLCFIEVIRSLNDGGKSD